MARITVKAPKGKNRKNVFYKRRRDISGFVWRIDGTVPALFHEIPEWRLVGFSVKYGRGCFFYIDGMVYPAAANFEKTVFKKKMIEKILF